MDANLLLTQFTIPTPCPMDWNRMPGDDRARFCERCGRHVYNLAAMSAVERASLTSMVLSDGEELCGRLYRRPDGTLVASECPAGPEAVPGVWQFTIRSFMAVIAACAAVLGITKLWLLSAEPPAPTPPAPRFSRPLILMGKMVPRRVASPATSAPSCPPAPSPDSGVSG
jgi:hypothetical protein